MAKITAGPLAGTISGKLGTVVFSRGRYGAYLRTAAMPTTVQSVATLSVRGRLSTLSKAWAALGATTKTAWKTWAATHPVVDRLGNSQVLQPNAAFIMLNARILQAGGTKIDLPPVKDSPPGLTALSVKAYVNTNAVTLTFAGTPLAANHCLASWVAVVDGAGRDFHANLLKLVDVSAAAQATGLEIGADVHDRFGLPIADQSLYLECEVWDKTTGLISGRSIAQTVVLAVSP